VRAKVTAAREARARQPDLLAQEFEHRLRYGMGIVDPDALRPQVRLSGLAGSA
jgi:hypothetical protein